MAENLKKRPSKGILKNSSSFDHPQSQTSVTKQRKQSKGAKWDEMNIIATYHPPGKDYGHMKVDEPKTPYNYEYTSDNVDGLDASDLAEKIRLAAEMPPKVLQDKTESESDSDEEMTEEERMKRKAFIEKRKKHYNEFEAIKLARKLLEEEKDDDDEDEEAGTSSNF